MSKCHSDLGVAVCTKKPSSSNFEFSDDPRLNIKRVPKNTSLSRQKFPVPDHLDILTDALLKSNATAKLERGLHQDWRELTPGNSQKIDP